MEKIVLVDDDADIRRVVEMCLKTAGYQVLSAEDGESGLRLIQAERPRLVVLDLMMPRMHGFQVCEAIRKDPALRETYITLASSTSAQHPKSEATSGVTPAKAKTSAQKLQILVAEDEAVTRELIEYMLEKRGWKVIAAENGREALRILESRPVDVVMLDQEMPEMGGVETARNIRRREAEGHRIPIIGLTGYTSPEDQAAMARAGVDVVLTKPFDAETLYRAIESFFAPVGEHPAPEERSPAIATGVPGLARVGGNAKLLAKLMRLFLADAPKKMEEIQKAVAQDDALRLAKAAHALKGSVEIFDAARVTELARSLQQTGRGGELSGARDAMRALEEEMQKLTKQLEAALSTLEQPHAEERSAGSQKAHGKKAGKK